MKPNLKAGAADGPTAVREGSVAAAAWYQTAPPALEVRPSMLAANREPRRVPVFHPHAAALFWPCYCEMQIEK